MTNANQQAKAGFINAFFDELDERLAFVQELSDRDHRNEAFTLCTAYIDSLALALYWPDDRSNRCFVRALRELGGEQTLDMCHVNVLSAALESMNRPKAGAVLEALRDLDESWDTVLISEAELTESLASRVDRDTMTWLENEIWRGTLAALVYRELRVPSVHFFGATPIVFSQTTVNGQPVPPLDLAMLLGCARRIAAEARRRSAEAIRWFGHDFKADGGPEG